MIFSHTQRISEQEKNACEMGSAILCVLLMYLMMAVGQESHTAKSQQQFARTERFLH